MYPKNPTYSVSQVIQTRSSTPTLHGSSRENTTVLIQPPAVPALPVESKVQHLHMCMTKQQSSPTPVHTRQPAQLKKSPKLPYAPDDFLPIAISCQRHRLVNLPGGAGEIPLMYTLTPWTRTDHPGRVSSILRSMEVRDIHGCGHEILVLIILCASLACI